jgi:hypothetical protein
VLNPDAMFGHPLFFHYLILAVFVLALLTMAGFGIKRKDLR